MLRGNLSRQKINPFHGTVALVRMAPLLIVLYKLSLLKIVEKTVDFGVISIPFCAINAHCVLTIYSKLPWDKICKKVQFIETLNAKINVFFSNSAVL